MSARDVTIAVQQAGFVLRGSERRQRRTEEKEEQSLLKQATPMLILAVLIALSYALEFVNPEFGKYAFIASTLIQAVSRSPKARCVLSAPAPRLRD